jgi:pimeloyl-ACP methyl ester carboxylesterase
MGSVASAIPSEFMRRTMRIFATLLVVTALLSASANASDRAREKRWADEVMPQLVVGDAVWLKHSDGDFLGLLTESKGAKTAIVLAHGVGVHPDHGLMGPLRAQLADAGFTTLSIQMPIAAADAKLEDYYPKLFPLAGERLAIAGKHLRAKGYGRVVLLAHSMGAWMANVYLDQAESTPYSAWITLGVTGRYSTRIFAMNLPMLRVDLPLLDIYGSEDDRPGVVASAGARASSLSGIAVSRQAKIEGADHFFARKQGDVVQVVADWLKSLPAQ